MMRMKSLTQYMRTILIFVCGFVIGLAGCVDSGPSRDAVDKTLTVYIPYNDRIVEQSLSEEERAAFAALMREKYKIPERMTKDLPDGRITVNGRYWDVFSGCAIHQEGNRSTSGYGVNGVSFRFEGDRTSGKIDLSELVAWYRKNQGG
ncbi:MAG: hypothetical protein IT462_15945 [Planctomycetes bacterium]|nr:hypothetical protein [Planctomycetota bacterium]